MSELEEKLFSFKSKYYQKKISSGLLVFLIITITISLLLVYLEYLFWFSPLARGALFFSSLSLFAIVFYLLVTKPLLQLKNMRKGISDLDAAKEIECFFPEIKDRLINAIQLSNYAKQENELLNAAIKKKVRDLSTVNFSQAVSYKEVKKYVGIFALVVFAGLLVSFTKPDIVLTASERLINYSEKYVIKAPFQFILLNKNLMGYRGEDFDIRIKIEGESIPSEIFLVDEYEKKFKLRNMEDAFTYSFRTLANDKTIRFEAAGFTSENYTIRVNDRPELLGMQITIVPPLYTKSKQTLIENNGNIQVPEGSKVQWNLQTKSTDRASIDWYGKPEELPVNNSSVVFDKVVNDSRSYEISLSNEWSQNLSDLTYSIEVLKDEFPAIKTEFIIDSTNFKYISAVGNITDDYGFTSLKAVYKKKNDWTQEKNIPLQSKLPEQSFFHLQSIDSLNLTAGDKVEVFLEVSDNDVINNFKTGRSKTFIIEIPGSRELEKMVDKNTKSVEGGLNNSKESSKELKEQLDELEKRIKIEPKISWQEKKLMDELIENKKKLNKEIGDLQKAHQKLNTSKNRFRNESKNIQEKNQKLQELLSELMDEQTLELYKKLKKLMEGEADQNEIQQKLEQIKQNEKTVEQELERALELFKRLKLESELEKSLQQLDSLSRRQEELSEKDPDSKSQEDLNGEFRDFREKMDEIKQMNQDLKNPAPIEDFEPEERQIQREMDEILKEIKEDPSTENLLDSESRPDEKEAPKEDSKPDRQNRTKKQHIRQKQKSASEKMKSLSKRLSKMQSGMQIEIMQANLDQLRAIEDNLIKLSFDQENIIKELRTVNQSDPRFLELSQKQLKLKDDASVIQDSLLSLASRVVQISTFVTREVNEINRNMDESLEFLKDRNRVRALSSQHFAMTSMNNLALLLDNTMQQMQMAMAESMGNTKGNQQSRSKGLPDLTEMQNQLSNDIKKLQGSGKEGRELSEELARMAAQQELIRQQMELLKQAQDGKPGGGMGGDELEKAIEMMEQNEVDLVNKRLTKQLINRQKQIETRMLEAEKAQRNQSEDEEREGETGKQVTRELPPEFEEYIKLKQKEIELLKSIPLDLNPFYKKEVNDYFRRISSGQ